MAGVNSWANVLPQADKLITSRGFVYRLCGNHVSAEVYVCPFGRTIGATFFRTFLRARMVFGDGGRNWLLLWCMMKGKYFDKRQVTQLEGEIFDSMALL